MRREGGAEGGLAPYTMPTVELERYKKGTKLPTIQLVAEHGNNVFTVRPTRAGVFTSAHPSHARRPHIAPTLPTPLAPRSQTLPTVVWSVPSAAVTDASSAESHTMRVVRVV